MFVEMFILMSMTSVYLSLTKCVKALHSLEPVSEALSCVLKNYKSELH